mmetsp:Transcript_66230/g.158423  ORF Transcript_66230/g.158423 Transcript_66230/m.158423 type:complete len:456 (+) Transcript_66230:90-1457(+)
MVGLKKPFLPRLDHIECMARANLVRAAFGATLHDEEKHLRDVRAAQGMTKLPSTGSTTKSKIEALPLVKSNTGSSAGGASPAMSERSTAAPSSIFSGSSERSESKSIMLAADDMKRSHSQRPTARRSGTAMMTPSYSLRSGSKRITIDGCHEMAMQRSRSKNCEAHQDKAADTDAMLASLGWDQKLDSELVDPVFQEMSKLEDAWARGQLQISSAIFQELQSEVSAGLCRFELDQDARMERVINLELMNVSREDGSVLVHLGKWIPSRGLRVLFHLPGGKADWRSGPFSQLQYVLKGELGWLTSRGQVKLTSRDKHVSVDADHKSGMQTRCNTTEHFAEFTKSPLRRRRLAQADGTTRGFSVGSPGSIFEMDQDDDYFDIAAEAGVEGVKVSAVIRSEKDVDLYSWLPQDVWSSRSQPHCKALLQQWTMTFEERVKAHMEGYAMLTSSWDSNFLN